MIFTLLQPLLKKSIDNSEKILYLIFMIIRCENCKTVFKLPDEKVKPEGTKVRCSVCKHLFTVFPIKSSTGLEEIEEKTRIAFVPNFFGDDKDDSSPITIKRETINIPSSIESLGHGIPLSQPEIKVVEESTQGLNEIMAAIEEGLKKSSSEDIPQPESAETDLNKIAEPPVIEKGGGQEVRNDNNTNLDIDSLLKNIADIYPLEPQKPQDTPYIAPTEELPDLSTLIGQQDENKNNFPAKEEVALPSFTDKAPKQAAPSSNLTTNQPPVSNQEDKLLIDLDKAFDSLFAENPPEPIQDQQPKRNTMLYMEAVPVASQSPPQSTSAKQTSMPDLPNPAPDINSSNLNLPDAIQDSLLSDDLSMFLSPQNTAPQTPPARASLMNTDLKSTGEDLMGLNGAQADSPLGELSSFEFGELGSDINSPTKSDNVERFSTTPNRSADLLMQMESIDISPLPANAPLSKPAPSSDLSLEPATVENESIDVKAPRKNIQPAPIKPATIALKDREKLRGIEIFKWTFTLLLLATLILLTFHPDKIFPEVRGDVYQVLRQPLIEDSINIEDFYYRQINQTDTLMIFSGYILLAKALPPDRITLHFRITDLSGNEIFQKSYPLVYTDNYDEIVNITTEKEIEEFLKRYRVKTITHKKSPFIVPVIIKNVDVRGIDIKSSIKVSLR